MIRGQADIFVQIVADDLGKVHNAFLVQANQLLIGGHGGGTGGQTDDAAVLLAISSANTGGGSLGYGGGGSPYKYVPALLSRPLRFVALYVKIHDQILHVPQYLPIHINGLRIVGQEKVLLHIIPAKTAAFVKGDAVNRRAHI